MPRLSPSLSRSIESALDAGRVNDALRLLAAVALADAAGVDALRLIALAARMMGADEEAQSCLIWALDRARSEGDLVGAVDALRRLETMGVDTGARWTELCGQVLTQGYGEASGDRTLVDRAGLGALPDGTDEELLAATLGALVTAAAPATPRALGPVPLIDAVEPARVLDVLRSLQLRVVRHRQRVDEVTQGSPAWVVSGVVMHEDVTHLAAPGSALVDVGDTRAFGVLRLLTLPPAQWAACATSPGVAEARGQLVRAGRISAALQRSAFFRALPASAQRQMLRRVRGISLSDDVLIAQGDTSPGLFVVVSGHVVVAEPADADDAVAVLEPGDAFGAADGEHDAAASYTVRARGQAEVVFVDVANLEELLADATEARRLVIRLGADAAAETGPTAPDAGAPPPV